MKHAPVPCSYRRFPRLDPNRIRCCLMSVLLGMVGPQSLLHREAARNTVDVVGALGPELVVGVREVLEALVEVRLGLANDRIRPQGRREEGYKQELSNS